MALRAYILVRLEGKPAQQPLLKQELSVKNLSQSNYLSYCKVFSLPKPIYVTLSIFWYKSKEARSSLPFIHHEPHSRPVKGSMSPKLKRKTGTKRKKLCYWPVLINAVACLFFGTLTLAVSLHHEIRHCLYQYELSTLYKFVLFFAKKVYAFGWS